MSWRREAVVISGYRIPRAAYSFAIEKLEANYESFFVYEDYLIDADGITGHGDTFLGKILYKVDEDSHAKEVDTILADRQTIEFVQKAFDHLLKEYYEINGLMPPSYNKWLVCRWI